MEQSMEGWANPRPASPRCEDIASDYQVPDVQMRRSIHSDVTARP
jgi:hypothetical protein